MQSEFDAWFDQYNFSFHSLHESREVVLPFRLLVLGDFGLDGLTSLTESVPLEEIATHTVTERNFDATMASLAITLWLPVTERPDGGIVHALGVSGFRVNLDSIASFHPDMLICREPTLSRVHQFIGRLKHLLKASQPGEALTLPAFDAEEAALLELYSGEEMPTAAGQTIAWSWLEFLIVDLEAELNLVLNQLLHHSRFRQVEATWRGLHWLVSQSASDALSQVDFVPASRAQLQHDLTYSATLEESGFFELLHTREYGQYGGRPYGAVIGDYQFGHGAEDIDLLRRLGNICRAAHCPFISGVSPGLFGISSFNALSGLTSLKEMLEGRQYIRWREFQSSEEAAYIVLTLPQILLRDLWRYEEGGVSGPVLEERIGSHGENSLWGNAAFAMASCLLRSFKRFRVCTHLSGADGGRVTGLPSLVNRETGDTLYPLEVMLSENREAELITLGFAPLNISKASASLLFPSANSLRWGYFQRHRDGARDPLGARLGAQLPYLFIILRIAHYLRVIYREQLGSTQSLAELREQLMSWLKRYVSDAENPPPAVRARRPLRHVELVETGTSNTGQWQSLTLVLTPHLRYGGESYSLEVDMASQTARQS